MISLFASRAAFVWALGVEPSFQGRSIKASAADIPMGVRPPLISHSTSIPTEAALTRAKQPNSNAHRPDAVTLDTISWGAVAFVHMNRYSE